MANEVSEFTSFQKAHPEIGAEIVIQFKLKGYKYTGECFGTMQGKTMTFHGDVGGRKIIPIGWRYLKPNETNEHKTFVVFPEI